jgi:ATP-binding cassette subfamily B protein
MPRDRFAPSEKPSDFGGVWKRIFAYMGRYRYALYACVALSIAGSLLSLIGPRKISEMTDIIESAVKHGGDVDLEGVAAIGVFLLALYAISAAMSFVQGQAMAYISQKTSGRIREDVSAKIVKVPLGFFDKASTGDLMSRVTNDADRMGQGMNQSLSQLMTACVMFFGTLAMMLITDVTLALTAVGCTALGFLAMWAIVKKSQVYFSRQQANLGRMNGHISETYSSQSVVMAYGGQKEALEKFDEINEALASTAVRSQFLSGTMMPLMGFIGNLGYVAVCLVGAVMVIDGSITIGTVVAFLIYIRLFTQPMSQISQAFNGMQSVAAGAERVFSFLDEPELSDESAKKPLVGRSAGHVEFRDVHFGYEPGKEVIKGFSAEVLPGQKVAIVGPTGAGKTTIVNLLMRFYEIGSGDILIDGVSVKDMSRAEVHRQFCMVLQDAWLFEGTVRENIVYGREDVPEERMEEACRAVGIDRHIAALPDGYDTVLGETAEMSAGQRQQLVIARAMVSDAPMLILDEATSSVDTRTEASIQKSMDRLSEGRTSFVIAHRLSTIRNADMILVMKDGNVIEKGTHDELMSMGGFYRDLYDSQFEKARRSGPEPAPDP